MRIIAMVAGVALALVGGTVEAQPLDKEKWALLQTANEARLKCLGTWMKVMAASDDPIEYVADAVISQCVKETGEFRARARSALTTLSPQDVSKVIEEQRTVVISGLVILRLDNKRKSDTRITGTLPEGAPPEPKTREGKLAECEGMEAEWKKWVAERGHVRVEMMEEHDRNSTECRGKANRLPLAADFHAPK